MTESESSELEKFQKTARSIRSSSDYSVPLGIIGKYLGLPASVTDYEIEALLIAATREKFKESLDADMALMALGLLKEFPSPRDSSENRSGIDLITVRRKKFIWTSSYIADRHSSSNKRRKVFYESCEDLEAAGEDAIKAVVKALNTEDGDAINAVAQKLYSKKVKINEYLDEAKEYLIYDKKGNIVDVKLQELKSIRQAPVKDISDESFPLNQEQKEDSINESVRKTDRTALASTEIIDGKSPTNASESENETLSDGSSFFSEQKKENVIGEQTPTVKVEVVPTVLPSPTKNRLFKVLAIICTISVSMLGVAATIFVVNYLVKNYEISTAKEESRHITAREIEIENKNIMLSLGKSTDLMVHIRPSELEPGDLFYVSTHPNVVYVDNIHSNHITAEKSLNSDAQRSVNIVVHDIDGVAQDTATVIVRGTQKNEAAIDDKNDDEASSTGFEANIDSE